MSIKCPKCGSSETRSELVKVNKLTSGAAGFGLGALTGNPVVAVTTGAVGASRGDYVKNWCTKCGHVWEPCE